jgi:hypothetical protein
MASGALPTISTVFKEGFTKAFKEWNGMGWA